MILSNTAVKILEKLAEVLRQISASDYSRRCEVLGGATVGQHVRHTIEFFQCFEYGYNHGVVNYDQRQRDLLIESDKQCALKQIQQITEFMGSIRETVSLTLEVRYNSQGGNCVTVETNSARELVYNIEHAVHHMAMIKIAVRDIARYVVLQDDFGIAASTIRYNQFDCNDD